LLPGEGGPETRAYAPPALGGSETRPYAAVGELNAPDLADEPLVRLMTTTRKEVSRDHIAVAPQYANIKDECYRCFDGLKADVLLPILRDNRVVGGLAVGARTTGDVYEAAEIDALSTVAQQAVMALIRIE